MDKVLFLLAGFNILYSQQKCNKVNVSEDLDICILTDSIDVQKPDVYFKIINKSNKKFIINPNGFYGKSEVLENGIGITPWISRANGYVVEPTYESCSKEIILIGPHDETEITLVMDSYDRGIYKYSKDKYYTKTVRSTQDKYTIRYSGCEKYISNLEKEGYIVLTDNLSITLPLYNY